MSTVAKPTEVTETSSLPGCAFRADLAVFEQHDQMSLPKRSFDIVCSLLGIMLFSPLLVVVALAVKLTSSGPILHRSKRVGKNNDLFMMPKFRSMRSDTPQIATHLLADPLTFLTPIGGFLRKSSMDELPQLFSILRGDLSLVGPRPALFNQHDLVALRTERGVHRLVPGLTGWAQVNGRDELPIAKKVEFDAEYIQRQSCGFDLKILLLTLMKVIRSEGVSH
jgi:O-antigen biosynthesis protein WbqP